MLRAPGITIATIVTVLYSYVSAQAPACLPGFEWSYNSLNQTPCTMTIALGGACNDGVFTLGPLEPGFVYFGPTLIGQTSCECSTVFYSLLSACALCQNHNFLDWSIYDSNCTTIYNQIFIDPIPSSTRIPHYAYLDVTVGNTFNVLAAMDAGGPESTPIPQATASSTTLNFPTPAFTSTSTSAGESTKSSKAGPIAGGTVGGVVSLAGIIAFILRRRRLSTPSVQTPSQFSSVPNAPQTMMGYGDGKYVSTMPASMTSGKIYDPNDPTTFPTNNQVGSNNTSSTSPDLNHRDPITPSFTGTGTHVSTPVGTARTQYTGAPEV